MRAGSLRHRVRIEKPVTVPSETGDPVVTWTLVAENVPAEIAPASVREFIAGAVGPMASQLTAKITMRWRPGIDPTMRIRHDHGGVVDLYNIAGVLVDGKSGREYLTLPVTRGANSG